MTRTQHWIVTTLAALGLLALAADITLATQNRSTQAEVTQRQQYLQQTVQLETLYREMARALAELAGRNNDQDVLALLQRNGISVNAAAPSPAPGTAVRK